jgi:hypothetical protein
MIRPLRLNPLRRSNPLPRGWVLYESHPIKGKDGSEDIYAYVPKDFSTDDSPLGPVLVIPTADSPVFLAARVIHENYKSGPYAGQFLGQGTVMVGREPTHDSLFYSALAHIDIGMDERHGSLSQMFNKVQDATGLFLAGVRLGRPRRK